MVYFIVLPFVKMVALLFLFQKSTIPQAVHRLVHQSIEFVRIFIFDELEDTQQDCGIQNFYNSYKF